MTIWTAVQVPADRKHPQPPIKNKKEFLETNGLLLDNYRKLCMNLLNLIKFRGIDSDPKIGPVYICYRYAKMKIRKNKCGQHSEVTAHIHSPPLIKSDSASTGTQGNCTVFSRFLEFSRITHRNVSR